VTNPPTTAVAVPLTSSWAAPCNHTLNSGKVQNLMSS
jgi:hypothetical protein